MRSTGDKIRNRGLTVSCNRFPKAEEHHDLLSFGQRPETTGWNFERRHFQHFPKDETSDSVLAATSIDGLCCYAVGYWEVRNSWAGWCGDKEELYITRRWYVRRHALWATSTVSLWWGTKCWQEDIETNTSTRSLDVRLKLHRRWTASLRRFWSLGWI